MRKFLTKRAAASAVSLLILVVLVFFLSRLTGDPTQLYLPVDASLEARENFRRLHGLDQPLLVQFLAYVGDLLTLDFGDSIRKSRPALEVVLEAFKWTLALALITMVLVSVAAIVFGALAAFNVGGALLWVLGICSAGYFFGNFAWVKENLDKIIWAMIFIPGLIAIFGAWRAGRKATVA